jgi:hypothetical protein
MNDKLETALNNKVWNFWQKLIEKIDIRELFYRLYRESGESKLLDNYQIIITGDRPSGNYKIYFVGRRQGSLDFITQHKGIISDYIPKDLQEAIITNYAKQILDNIEKDKQDDNIK